MDEKNTSRPSPEPMKRGAPPCFFSTGYHPKSGQSNVQHKTRSCAPKNEKKQTYNITKNASASSMTQNEGLHRYRLLKTKPPFLGPILLITDGPLVHRALQTEADSDPHVGPFVELVCQARPFEPPHNCRLHRIDGERLCMGACPPSVACHSDER